MDIAAGDLDALLDKLLTARIKRRASAPAETGLLWRRGHAGDVFGGHGTKTRKARRAALCDACKLARAMTPGIFTPCVACRQRPLAAYPTSCDYCNTLTLDYVQEPDIRRIGLAVGRYCKKCGGRKEAE